MKFFLFIYLWLQREINSIVEKEDDDESGFIKTTARKVVTPG
jgi:hypothetical protein